MQHSSNAGQSVRSACSARHRRRGAMLVLIVLLLPILLFLVAISVDVGYMQLTRAEMRAATDAAARAAGESLSRTQDLNKARQAAKDLAIANRVAGKPLILAENDIVFGRSTLQPDGSWRFNARAVPINSVQINAARTRNSASGSVPLLFGRVIGVSTFEPTQTASTVRLDRDICLVVDRSSSMKLSLSSTAETMSTSNPRFNNPPIMNDSRWGALDSAVRVFVDALATTPYIEHVALVSFASSGTWANVSNNTVDTNQPLTEDTTRITSAMAAISSKAFNGSTNTSAGIDAGVAALTDPGRTRPYAAKTIVLLTDGFPTLGRSPVLAARDAAARDIVLHTIIFGADIDQTLMQQTAAAGHGNYYHAPDAASLRAIFREIALSLPVVFTE